MKPTPLITRAGYDRLKQELDQLWRVERPQTTRQLAWAASLGDRSENADYKYNKRKLAELDRRIRYLRATLARVKIVEYSPEQQGRVFFGASVRVMDAENHALHFKIVGGDEIFQQSQVISIDSPMARALLKKQVGDAVWVETPEGEKMWQITEISYDATDGTLKK